MEVVAQFLTVQNDLDRTANDLIIKKDIDQSAIVLPPGQSIEFSPSGPSSIIDVPAMYDSAGVQELSDDFARQTISLHIRANDGIAKMKKEQDEQLAKVKSDIQKFGNILSTAAPLVDSANASNIFSEDSDSDLSPIEEFMWNLQLQKASDTFDTLMQGASITTVLAAAVAVYFVFKKLPIAHHKY